MDILISVFTIRRIESIRAEGTRGGGRSKKILVDKK